jgi:hypothetical protein
MDFTSRNVIALAALEECEHLYMKYRNDSMLLMHLNYQIESLLKTIQIKKTWWKL